MNRVMPMLVLIFSLAFYFISERTNFFSESEEGGPTVVSLWAFATPAQTAIELKSEFETKFPHIRVEVQTVPWLHMQQKTLWAIAANSNVPDIIVGSSEWTGGLISNGALEPLDGLIGKDYLARYFPATLGIYRFPEIRRSDPQYRGPLRQYGIPLDLDLMMMYYREDLVAPYLRQLNMSKFPTTWDGMQLLGDAMGAAVRIDESNPYLLYLDPLDPVPMSMAFLPSAGASFLNQKFDRAVFDSPESVGAFAFFQRLLRSGAAVQWNRSTMEDPLILYKSGRAAANITGPWYGKLLESKLPEQAGKWRVALFPRRDADQPTCGLGGACIAMPYNAPHKAEAIEFIKFMMTEPFALAYFDRVGSPPPQATAWRDPRFSEPVPYFGGQKVYEVVRQAIETARPMQLMPNSEITNGPVRWALEQISVKGESAYETLKKATEEANEILAE